MIEFAFMVNNSLVNAKELNEMECIQVIQEPPVVVYGNIELETADGERETKNNVFKPFDIRVRFLIRFTDRYDRALKQSEFYRFIFQRNSYYIMHELMPGKRYPVQPQSIEPEEIAIDGGVYEVTFKVYKALVESIETTLLTQDVLTQKWQYSQGLILENYQYNFDKNHFSIFNLGDFTINPRKKHYLKINLSGRSDGAVTIFNQTTGERLVFNSSLSKEQKDLLSIDGIHVYKNGVVRNIDWNGILLTLVPGENKFIIENVSQVKISFDTRFLYKE